MSLLHKYQRDKLKVFVLCTTDIKNLIFFIIKIKVEYDAYTGIYTRMNSL